MLRTKTIPQIPASEGSNTGASRGRTPHALGARRNKYRAKPVRLDGHYFPSQAECARYLALRLEEKAGAIRDLKIHPRYDLNAPGGIKVCVIELDFSYWRGNTFVSEDVKGLDTPVSKLKRKWFEAQYKQKITLIRGRKK